MKKNIFKYVLVGMSGLLLTTACSDEQLDTNPTTAVSGTTITSSNDNAMIGLNGIYRSMYTSGWSTTGNTHQCFGISAYSMTADCMGEDFIQKAAGSGWFWYDTTYDVKDAFTSSAWRPYDLWFAFYQWISNANYLISMDADDMSDIDRMYILGQAYAIRAYSYFMIAQWFARTYKGHESDPCGPIYTEPTVAGTQGKPRATVQEVYKQINEDIVKAVSYLKQSLNTTLEKDKSFITYPVALGLQARIALTQEDWATAAKAAEEVINSGSYSIQPVNGDDFKADKSNFINSVSFANVMWGANIIPDQSGMYGSLYAHMDAVAAMYAGYDRSPKSINSDTYELMGTKDTRRAWWNPTDEGNAYQQEKFHFSTLKTYLGDYVWMRIEEMYLIAAEAECMQGHDAVAQGYLNTLVQTRDVNYDCSNRTGTDMGALTTDRTGSLREAIIDQRRIELWGEYGRIYDIRRLRQGFKRTEETGWPLNALLSTRPTEDPECYMWVMTIPQAEFDGNKNMDSKTDQNPVGDYPDED